MLQFATHSIKIATSKTDQFGKNPFTVYLQRIPGSFLCPAAQLLEILATAGGNEPLVSVIFGTLISPLSYSCFNSRLKNLASRLGLPVGNISTHSLRHGGTSMLKSLGFSVGRIMTKGNWRSAAVYRYLHQSKEEMLNLDKDSAQYLSGLL